MVDNHLLCCPIKLPPLDGTETPSRTASISAKSEPLKPQNIQSFQAVMKNSSRPSPNISVTSPSDEAEDVSKQFESFLISLIFKAAFSSQLSTGIFGKDYASKMYMDMFIDAASEEASKNARLGIAEVILSDINRGKEKTSEPESSDADDELQRMRQSDERQSKEYLPGMRR